MASVLGTVLGCLGCEQESDQARASGEEFSSYDELRWTNLRNDISGLEAECPEWWLLPGLQELCVDSGRGWQVKEPCFPLPFFGHLTAAN